jgi:hypothetical protein
MTGNNVSNNSSDLGCCKFYYLTKAEENLGVHQLLPYRTALDSFQKYTNNNTCKIRKIAKEKIFYTTYFCIGTIYMTDNVKAMG